LLIEQPSARHDDPVTTTTLDPQKVAETYPIPCGPIVIRRSQAVCQLPDRKVTITGPSALLAELVERCDGNTSLENIRASLARKWPTADLDPLIAALMREGVLVDAEFLASSLWTYAKNPRVVGAAPPLAQYARLPFDATERLRSAPRGASYRPAASALKALLERRASVRVFGDSSVELKRIATLLWATNGVLKRRARIADVTLARRTVPSGGGIYPLTITFINLRPTRGLREGIYRVYPRIDQRVTLVKVGHSTDPVFRAFGNPRYLAHAQGIIVISGSLRRTARKYGNRAMLFVPLEAGHAAQNALLAAAELGIGAVEIGAFLEDSLARVVRAGSDEVPLTTIVFGARPAPADLRVSERAVKVEFQWSAQDAAGYTLPFHLGFARVEGVNARADWSSGKSPSAREAYAKAFAEAVERYACSRPSGLVRAKLAELKRVVPPEQLVAYDPTQYRSPGFPFRPFDPHRPQLWKEATDLMRDRPAWVLGECVYFGASVRSRGGSRPYTLATSSGVAAFPSFQGALVRAVLELIERDAFMLAWLARRPGPTIARGSLPAALKRRLDRLEEAGVRAVVRDLSGDLAPVAGVYLRHRTRPFARITSSAAFDIAQAVDHALAEAESQFFQYLRSDPLASISPSEVRHPADHGQLYCQKRYSGRADWFGRARVTVTLRQAGAGLAKRYGELMDTLKGKGLGVLAVELTPARELVLLGRRPMHVVRALVPGLVPVSFGFGTEPWGMPRLIGALGHGRHPRSLHPVFPHPMS
jgi:thiazole/oxazole-forming peptide maturase SagD family component